MFNLHVVNGILQTRVVLSLLSYPASALSTVRANYRDRSIKDSGMLVFNLKTYNPRHL